MPLTLVSDSTTRSVSEGILAENKQPQPLADASGYKVSAIRHLPTVFADTDELLLDYQPEAHARLKWINYSLKFGGV